MRFPTMPLYFVAKEISYEDDRMMLEKMADRLFHAGCAARSAASAGCWSTPGLTM
jgi:hypothetical protein